ncbi:DMT family transporter [Ciceribacter sp. L1K22]|uniref:DMT family transporter n=1 Tax=Ciceribacter sp. L1K22 TaxID=2820275 RepID=UPI001ABE8359|nr:DMT family transporter [Ciceribacter sp. L1K22]MBO3760954.1 DMT family transporter [Ciceribacter sp. L1K22]
MRSTFILTAVAMVAFAANSLLARQALGVPAIDPAGYTALRVISGAIVLFLLFRRRRGLTHGGSIPGSWPAALALFLYAIAFSAAYVDLGAATGALILFSSVQATMLVYAVARGDRPNLNEALGFAVAFAAFVYLVLPGAGRPDLFGSLLMIVSGVAWGAYTLLGRGSVDPLGETAGNFARASAFCIPLGFYAVFDETATTAGVTLALASGIVASGLGYAVWYSALRGLTTFRAALIQLSVPVIAAAGAILLLGESLTLHFVIAGAVVLGGIAFAILAKQKRQA